MATVLRATEEAAPTRKRSTRGASFTPNEDAAIAKAWISASEDAVDGAEQKGDEFMAKVQRFYNENFKPANREPRSFESVKNRCKLVLKNCTLFSSCYARISRSPPSGASPNDIITLATALYNGVEVSNLTEDCGRPFRFREAWEILRVHDKFVPGAEGEKSKESVCSAASPDGDLEENDSSISKQNSGLREMSEESKEARPAGRKRVKEERHRAKYAQDKLRLAAKSVAAEEDRNTVLKRHYEIMLFTSAPAGCDGAEALEYFSTMRARALEEIRDGTKRMRTSAEHTSNGGTAGTVTFSADEPGDEISVVAAGE